MDGLKSAAHGQGLAHFLQRQVGFAGQHLPQLLLVALNQLGLGAGEAMAGAQVAHATTLLKEFFNQTEGNAEAPGDLLTVAFLPVISSQDALAQVQGDRFSHKQTIAKPPNNGYSFI